MKLKLILVILITAAFTSCVRDLEVSEPQYSDIGWVTSKFRSQEFTVGVHDFLTFNDVSVNAVEHTWTISEGSAFLKGPIERNDTILDPFIIPNAGLTTDAKTINVLFQEGGYKAVNLRNLFKDSVAFRTSEGPIPAIREGNFWVIDTTFLIDVYDTIVPVIDIRRPDGTSVPFQDENDVIVIEAGDALTFVDLSTKDRITDRKWRIEESGVAEDSVGIFVFKKLGEFEGVADFTREGVNIPFDFERYEIPALFKVIPSSKPFVVAGDVIELEDETIQVPFNGEFAPFGSQEEFFTVKVNGIEFEIEAVSKNGADATLLEIKLKDPIYRPDVITVSYDGNGTLESTDTRKPVAFTDLPVTMHRVNLFEGPGYDYEDQGAGWSDMWDTAAPVEYTTEQASSGDFSAKLDGGAGGNVKFQSNKIPFDLEPGEKYLIEFDIYFDEASNYGSFSPWLLPNWKQFWTGAGGYAKGEWHTVSKQYTAGGADTGRVIMFASNGGAGVMYLDNWVLLKDEVRP